jgi:hypothetical protein
MISSRLPPDPACTLGCSETPPHPDHRFATIRPLPARGERCAVRAEMSRQTSRRQPHLSPLAGRGRIASAIRVRGRLREHSGEAFKNTLDIPEHVVVPEPDDTVIMRTQPFVANQVLRVTGVLPAVYLDDQTALAAQKIHRIGTDRLLTDEFETKQGTASKPLPQRILGIGRVSPQPTRSLGLKISRLAHVETAPPPALRADLSPHAGRGYHVVAAA